MKTSLDLPDDLYRRVKSKSALEGRAVREVATALFTAWVDGKVAVEPEEAAIQAAAEGSASKEPDPQQDWLLRWRELSARVSDSKGVSPGLVAQLKADRQ